jgi:ubiquinol-cytochrome c reductase cytochrome c subunit
MPVFPPSAIDDQQLASIVRYVEYLKDPEDPGGASLGRVGPVPEGFVAWVFGIGAILLIARWLGAPTRIARAVVPSRGSTGEAKHGDGAEGDPA